MISNPTQRYSLIMLGRLWFLVVLAWAFPGWASQLPPVKVCWESELKPPYLELGSAGKVEGILVSRLENVLQNANIPYQHILLPWSRCLQQIKKGAVDLVPNASYKTKRAEYAYYSAPVYASELVLYYQSKHFPSPPRIPNLQSLAKYRVGGIKDFNYSFYEGLVKIDPLVKKRTQLIGMLKRGRIDFAVLQRNVVDEMVARRQVNLRGLDFIPDPVKPRKEYHILVSKQSSRSEQLLQLINQHLEQSRNQFILAD